MLSFARARSTADQSPETTNITAPMGMIIRIRSAISTQLKHFPQYLFPLFPVVSVFTIVSSIFIHLTEFSGILLYPFTNILTEHRSAFHSVGLQFPVRVLHFCKECSYLVHQLPVSNHPKTGMILKRILRGWRTALGFAPGNKGNYKVPDTD